MTTAAVDLPHISHPQQGVTDTSTLLASMRWAMPSSMAIAGMARYGHRLELFRSLVEIVFVFFLFHFFVFIVRVLSIIVLVATIPRIFCFVYEVRFF